MESLTVFFWWLTRLFIGAPFCLNRRYFGDHPRTCKWIVTTLYKPWKGHLEGVPQPYLGDLLTVVIKHLLSGVILQVVWILHWTSAEAVFEWSQLTMGQNLHSRSRIKILFLLQSGFFFVMRKWAMDDLFFFYQMRSKQDNKGSTLTSNASVLRVQMYRTRWAIDRVIRPWPKVNGFRWIFFTLLLSYFTLLITGFWGGFSLGFSYLKRRPSSTLGRLRKASILEFCTPNVPI